MATNYQQNTGQWAALPTSAFNWGAPPVVTESGSNPVGAYDIRALERLTGAPLGSHAQFSQGVHEFFGQPNWVVEGAHDNQGYRDVTPEERAAYQQQFAQQLQSMGLDPNAEYMSGWGRPGDSTWKRDYDRVLYQRDGDQWNPVTGYADATTSSWGDFRDNSLPVMAAAAAAMLGGAAAFGGAAGGGAGAGAAAGAGGAASGAAGAAGSGVITGGSGLLAGGAAGMGGTGAGLSVGAGAGGLGAGLGSSIGTGLGTAGAGLGAAGGLVGGGAAGAGSMGIFDGLLGSIGSGFGSQLAGGLLGAVAGGRDDRQTQTSGPPAYALPYIQQVMQQAAQQYGTPYQAYTGDRVAGQSAGGLSGYEQNAFGAMQNWANGSGQLNTANDRYNQLAAGQNPFAVTGVAYQTPNTAQTSTASNPYIGQTTPGISGANSQVSNPYLGATTQQSAGAQASSAGRNALLGMDNPNLNRAIQSAQDDVTRNYNLTVAPQQAAAQVASGSFGNTGLQQVQAEQQRNLARELGNVSTNMRMQDYGLQAQLGESDLNRTQGLNQFNAGLTQGNQQFNSGLMQGDLSRNMQGAMQQGMFNAGNALDVQRFNAGLAQGDLSRNAQLQQGLGQFNAGAQNQGAQFNANTLNNAGQFNAGVSNNMAQFNSQQGAGLMQTGLQGLMGIDSRLGQGAQALMGLGQYNRGIEQQGLDAQYQEFLRQQGYPQQQLSSYADLVRQMTFGGQQSQTQQGNPWLGALGGMQMAGGLFGGPSMTTAGPRYSNSGIGAWTAPNYSLF